MLALQIVGVCVVISVLGALLMYSKGYKQESIEFLKVVGAFVLFYIIIVLSIGLAPISWG